MGNSQVTREKILREAAILFNQQGYAGASMSDLMRATGLQKGGIYNHFGSKDDLALAAFDYAVQQITTRYMAAIRSQRHAIARLNALLDIYDSFLDNPPLVGGCPLLNTAVESDDTHPALRQRTQQAMTGWHSLLQRVLAKGVERGELSPSIDLDQVVTVMIAGIEGGVMLAQLYDDAQHLRRVIQHLRHYLQGLVR